MVVAAAGAALGLGAPVARAHAQASGPIFRFTTNGMWLNLHSFLYVLSRDAAGLPDRTRAAVAGAPSSQERGLASLSADELAAWRQALEAYGAGLGRLDAVFDAPLVSVTGALALAGDGPLPGPPAVPAETRALLDRVAPIYRRVWWPEHQDANQEWVAAMEPLLARHGADILAFITRVYIERWPDAGYPVNVSAYANWAGAYSTSGNLLVVASLAPTLSGPAALEITFHEAMHQWDESVQRALAATGRRLGVDVPDGLSHAMIFYTAGDAVRRVVPGYAPYAEANGIWDRRMGAFKPALDAGWRPWLDGRGDRETAFEAILEALRESP